MQKKPLIGKCLAVGIILLFAVMAISPVINARNNTIVSKPVSTSEKENTVSITLLEYKPDGSIAKSIVKVSCEQEQKLRMELNGVNDLNTRLSIYKKYNIIPSEVTVEKLRAGMEEKAQKMMLTQEKLKQIISTNSLNTRKKFNLPYTGFVSVSINMMCNVSGIGRYFTIPFGLTSLTWLLLLGKNGRTTIPCFDIQDTLIGYYYIFTSGGLLPDQEIETLIGVVKLNGFVGYMEWELVPTPVGWELNNIISGFAVYFRSIGIPPD
ncbi:MAG: hypothetical protein IMZ52_02660 [Actinobacteria bacterium]|nr:hypothetical protein [Actinomycetota bacterium]MBE3120638.1 hypothetical protein [Thermoplasmata archaeon]